MYNFACNQLPLDQRPEQEKFQERTLITATLRGAMRSPTFAKQLIWMQNPFGYAEEIKEEIKKGFHEEELERLPSPPLSTVDQKQPNKIYCHVDNPNPRAQEESSKGPKLSSTVLPTVDFNPPKRTYANTGTQYPSRN